MQKIVIIEIISKLLFEYLRRKGRELCGNKKVIYPREYLTARARHGTSGLKYERHPCSLHEGRSSETKIAREASCLTGFCDSTQNISHKVFIIITL